MKKKQAGYDFMLFTSVVAVIVNWTTNNDLVWSISLSIFMSFTILDLLGVFNVKDKEPDWNAVNDAVDNLQEKQKNHKPAAATMYVMDRDGNEGEIHIAENGDITTKGKADPEIVAELEAMRREVQIFGPEFVAKELQKAIIKAEKENKG